MSGNPLAMTVASDEALTALVRRARRSLVVLAPGLTKAVAEAVAERWRILGPDAVSVILDVDAEVCRLGYGEIEALQLLERTASCLGGVLQRQPGIRIGLL